MSSSLVRRFHWFWAWQDEAEEQWLSQMARQGMHMASVSYPGLYTFSRGQPRHDVYRLDYRSLSTKDWGDYLGTLQDEGWAHVGQMGNWHYFRHAAVEGEEPEVCADPASKADKYRRILTLYVVLLPAWIIVLTSSIWEGPPAVAKMILRFIVFVLMLVWVYALLRILKRVNELRRQ